MAVIIAEAGKIEIECFLLWLGKTSNVKNSAFSAAPEQEDAEPQTLERSSKSKRHWLFSKWCLKKFFFPEIHQAATSTVRTMGNARTAPAEGPGATTGASTGTTGAVSRHRKHGHSHFFFL